MSTKPIKHSKYNKGFIESTDEDNIYYNVVIPHDINAGTNTSPIKFEETRTIPILDNPEEYYASVVNFRVPGNNIPIFIFQENTYTVTLDHDGDVVQETVQLIPQDFNSGDDPTFIYTYQHMLDMVNSALETAFNGLAGAPVGSKAPYFILDKETQLISLVAQKAFYSTEQFKNIVLTPNSFPVSDGLKVPDLSDPNRIDIYVNTALNRFFGGTQRLHWFTNDPQGRDHQFLMNNEQNNCFIPCDEPCPDYLGGWNANTNTPALASGVGTWNTYYIVTTAGATVLDGTGAWNVGDIVYFEYQAKTNPLPAPAGIWKKYSSINCVPDLYLKNEADFNILGEWSDFVRLVWTTNLIPISPEFVPGIFQGPTQAINTNIYKEILIDYNPKLQDGGDFRNTLEYERSTDIRLIDLHGHDPLRAFDLQVFWQDKRNVLRPVSLSPDEIANIKIQFISKDIFKGRRCVDVNLED